MGIDSNDYETADKMAALDTCSERAGAYAAMRKYKAYMNRETDKAACDWAKITPYLMRQADKDYDGKITDSELVDALAY